jgi:hypothetical protein
MRVPPACASRGAGNGRAFREERARRAAGLPEVRRALPADAALVSFVRYTHSAAGRSQPPAPGYVAFVLRGTRDPVAVRLGDADAIDADVARWRRAATGYGYRLAESRRATHEAGTRRVLLVPDGALSFISFAALPPSPACFVIDDWALHHLSAERDRSSPAAAAGALSSTINRPCRKRST